MTARGEPPPITPSFELAVCVRTALWGRPSPEGPSCFRGRRPAPLSPGGAAAGASEPAQSLPGLKGHEEAQGPRTAHEPEPDPALLEDLSAPELLCHDVTAHFAHRAT